MLLMRWLRASNWVRYRLEHLRKWREYALKVAKAAEDILGE